MAVLLLVNYLKLSENGIDSRHLVVGVSLMSPQCHQDCLQGPETQVSESQKTRRLVRNGVKRPTHDTLIDELSRMVWVHVQVYNL